jgi:thiamine biosynthesis lipoprotein
VSRSSDSEIVVPRRRALSILAFGGAAAAATMYGLSRRAAIQPRRQSRTLMGTIVNVSVCDEDVDAADAAIEATLDRMATLEATLSRYRGDSEVGRLNDAGDIDDAGPALLEVIEVADRLAHLSDGAFDITVGPLVELYQQAFRDRQQLPDASAIDEALQLVDHRDLVVEGRRVSFRKPGMRITLDGVGKGYIVDRGVAVLRERGYDNVLAEAGGDLVARGHKVDATPWTIGIQAPRPGMRLVRFDAVDVAVATSGDYMQPYLADCSHHHIIDPRRGRSAPELASSTVVAPTAALADGLATLTMVLGPRASIELIESQVGCEGHFVAKDRAVFRTTGFAKV